MLLVIAIASLIIFTAVFGVAFFFMGQYINPEPSLIQTRLDQIKANPESENIENSKISKKNLKRFFREEGYSEDNIGRFFSKLSIAHHYQKLLWQAGITTPVDRFIISAVILPIIATVLAYYITGIPSILIAPILVPIAVNIILSVQISKRLKKFNAQFPEALALMNSALRAGHAFQSAVSIVSTEMTLPIKREFTELLNDLNLGIQMKESLNKMVNTVNLPDVRMFATAIMIQREAGGNLTEILGNLSTTIRERFKLKRQISTLTAQARITGYILAVAPTAVLTLMIIFYPDYILPFIQHPIGMIALGVSAVMQIIGFVIIMQIIKIRI